MDVELDRPWSRRRPKHVRAGEYHGGVRRRGHHRILQRAADAHPLTNEVIAPFEHAVGKPEQEVEKGREIPLHGCDLADVKQTRSGKQRRLVVGVKPFVVATSLSGQLHRTSSVSVVARQVLSAAFRKSALAPFTPVGRDSHQAIYVQAFPRSTEPFPLLRTKRWDRYRVGSVELTGQVGVDLWSRRRSPGRQRRGRRW